MNIFLTGSESFIGTTLWEMLVKAGHEVSGIDVAPVRKLGATQMDLRDPKLERQIPEGAMIIHLAAVSTDGLCKANPLEALDINLTGTLRLAQAATKRNCSQFVFASSEWVYGDVANDDVQKEDTPIDVTRMASVYAFSKLAGERMLALSGLPNVTILRFGIVYGPREKNWSAVEHLLESVRQGNAISVGSLKTGRRFIDVEDLCEGIIASLGQRGLQTFNLSGDRTISLGEVIETAHQVVGKTVQVTETRPQSVSIRNPDNSKAARMLGWRPKKEFATGMKQLLLYLTGRKNHA